MLTQFFLHLKSSGLPISLKELLDLLAALEQGIVEYTIDDFYEISRLCLIKDEKHYDLFDQAFGRYFEGLDAIDIVSEKALPEDWLNNALMRQFSEEEKAQIEAMGGFEKLMETLKDRLKEQKGRHQGGNKWIGTGGTSPFGAYGYNPEGVRIGQNESRHRRAIKVWDKREFKNLDSHRELGTRNIKMALRKLREFAREGANEELDIDQTIKSTAENAGYLDLKMVRERHNAVKVLLLFDIGGSMDDHIRMCEEMFSAAKSEFKHLEYYYFHNFLYEFLWKNNVRRWSERTTTWDFLNTYGKDYKLIIVGDATMSPYEVSHIGGSVEHWNEEPGTVWLKRILSHFEKAAWLNPQPEAMWEHHMSIHMIKEAMEDRMYAMTRHGIEQAIKKLRK